MAKRQKQQGQRLYGMKDKYDDGFGIRFYFHAKDQKDADSKAYSWNRHHGFCDSPGWGWHIAVDAAEAVDAGVHDEYIF